LEKGLRIQVRQKGPMAVTSTDVPHADESRQVVGIE
jgi:hypothetical protein